MPKTMTANQEPAPIPGLRKLEAAEIAGLLEILKTRFTDNPQRHPGLSWDRIAHRLNEAPALLSALQWMEETGGEPDAMILEPSSEAVVFVDCARESPAGRRSLCYDQPALDSRPKNKPVHSALGLAEEIGLQLLDESDYRRLQELDPVDLKTSSWIMTPADIRDRGGALFGDRRYDTVFIYHNGAESWYSSRGFRGKLTI